MVRHLLLHCLVCCCFSCPRRIFPNTPLRCFLQLMSIYNVQTREFLEPPLSLENPNSIAQKQQQIIRPTMQNATEIFGCHKRILKIRDHSGNKTVFLTYQKKTNSNMTCKQINKSGNYKETCGASLGRGNESLLVASGSHDQGDRHAHIW